jgi:hypothetical protein
MAVQTRAYLGLPSCGGRTWAPTGGDGGGRPVAHKADSRLEDPLVLDEIELYGELVIAASSSDEPLSQDQIDQVLGLRGAKPGR